MHPLKIVILLVLFYLLYRLYMSGRKKRLAQREQEKQGRPAIDDVLVQDPVCGAYVPRSQALQQRRAGREFFFCSEKCRREFAERDQQADKADQ
ncbi:YHS domain-containing protein [Desulfurivibrio sp. C05AmB]|jgi:uncharacterized protein|uniref:YHS domain-containing protein n=1 Tax=Desulfurivibrio sp. C05AmB TaxID=3374371 RepID=UPI00376EFDBC